MWHFQARPEPLIERIGAQPLATDVVIDEVQKVPALLDVVHKLVEGKVHIGDPDV